MFDKLLPFLVMVPVFLLSLSFHEFMHAYVAHLLGDDTAKLRGRMTLNPIAHIDLFGTVILPILLLLTAGFAIGWAKPVPVNPYNFRDARKGNMLVSAAGPLSNFGLAVVFSLLFRLVSYLSADSSVITFILLFCSFSVLINILLGLFNLIPFPPLDGSGILGYFLPVNLYRKYEMLFRNPMAMIIILLIAWFVLWRLISILGFFLANLLLGADFF